MWGGVLKPPILPPKASGPQSDPQQHLHPQSFIPIQFNGGGVPILRDGGGGGHTPEFGGGSQSPPHPPRKTSSPQPDPQRHLHPQSFIPIQFKGGGGSPHWGGGRGGSHTGIWGGVSQIRGRVLKPPILPPKPLPPIRPTASPPPTVLYSHTIQRGEGGTPYWGGSPNLTGGLRAPHPPPQSLWSPVRPTAAPPPTILYSHTIQRGVPILREGGGHTVEFGGGSPKFEGGS